MLVIRLAFEDSECEEDDKRAQRFSRALEEAIYSNKTPDGLESLANELSEMNSVMVIDKRKADALMTWLMTLDGYRPKGHPFQPVAFEWRE